MLPKLRDWAQRQAERSQNRTVGIYLGRARLRLQHRGHGAAQADAAGCWADLIKPEFKGEVQMADPNSSGTAWTMLATIVQLMGEDQAFDYMKKLNGNINEYTKAGAAPALAAGPGRDADRHRLPARLIDVADAGKPVQVVSPCEGTGYEIGSMSAIKGARHLDEAKKFYDWALTPGGAEARRGVPAATRSRPTPRRRCRREAPDLSQDQADRI